jgi:hypothetical protein
MNNIVDIKKCIIFLLISKYLWSIYKCYTWINYIICMKNKKLLLRLWYIIDQKS